MVKRFRYRTLLKTFWLILILVLLAHASHQVYVYLHPSVFAGQDIIKVEGVIVDIPHLNNRGVNFLFATPQGLLKLNWYQQKLLLTPGQKWQLQVKLKNSAYFANPGEFNYERYLRQQNIQGSGYVINSNVDQLLGFSWSYATIDYLRFLWYQRLLSATDGLSTQAILLALILGDKTELNKVDWQSFERTGTSYFMVISGLHIVLFAAMGTMLIRFLWSLSPRLTLKIPAIQVGLAAGLVFGVIYGVMAGALVPTQRAVLMLLLVGIAKLFLRSISSMRALMIAFILIMAWDPLSIFKVAFWMSFIAVYFLIFCFSDRMGKLSLWQEWTYPQWLMFWVLVPVSIYTFNQFAGIAIFTNLIAMPIMMYMVIPTALLGAFLIWLSPMLGAFIFQLSNYFMQKLTYLLHFFAFQDWWGVWLLQISFINMLLGLVGVLVIFLPSGIPGRWLGWFMLIPILIPLSHILSLGEVEVMSLKTQNGPVEIVTTKHHVVLLQTIHNLREAHSDIRHIIEAYCIYAGIQQIDLWIINLNGSYHNVQLFLQDMAKIKVGKIALNHHFKIFDSKMIFCKDTQSWLWDGVRFNLKQSSDQLCELSFIGKIFKN